MTAAIYNELNPAGFDYQILEIQSYLGKLSFIEAIFGAAKLQDDGKRKYPQGRKLGGDVDLTIDDTYTSRLFFKCKDPINSSPKENTWDWTDSNVELSQPFSLICHFNLLKIANAGINITSSEQIKTAILFALNKVPKLQIISMVENIDAFWRDFTSTPEMQGYGRYPYYCLRIEGILTYFALPMNGSLLQYDPSALYDASKTITPNSNTGYANTN